MKLCGSITYTATYKSDPIDSSSTPLSYDAASRIFTLFTPDLSLDGTSEQFEVTAVWTDYPSIE